MTVVSMAEWRRRRAERLAQESNHPTVYRGDRADLLAHIEQVLVPMGFRPGLWRSTPGPLGRGHVVRDSAAHSGYVATRCGMTISPRRAEPEILVCRRCFPS